MATLTRVADPETAVASLEKLKTVAPAHAHEDIDATMEIQKLLLEEDKNFDTAVGYYKLGSHHAGAGRIDEAQRAFDKALALCPDDPRDQAYVKAKVAESKAFHGLDTKPSP